MKKLAIFTQVLPKMISTCRRKSPDFCVYTWKSSRTNSRRNETTARFCWTISFPCLYINAFCTAFLGLRDIIHGFLLPLFSPAWCLFSLLILSPDPGHQLGFLDAYPRH